MAAVLVFEVRPGPSNCRPMSKLAWPLRRVLMASNCPRTGNVFSVGGFRRGRILRFHQPSGPRHGVNRPAAFPTRRLSRMTRSAAKASLATAGNEHPRRRQYPAAAYLHAGIDAQCHLVFPFLGAWTSGGAGGCERIARKRARQAAPPASPLRMQDLFWWRRRSRLRS